MAKTQAVPNNDFFGEKDIEDLDVEDVEFGDEDNAKGNKTDDSDVPNFSSTTQAKVVLDKDDDSPQNENRTKNGVSYPNYGAGADVPFTDKPEFEEFAEGMVLDASSQPAGIAPKDMPYKVVVVTPPHDTTLVVRKAVRE